MLAILRPSSALAVAVAAAVSSAPAAAADAGVNDFVNRINRVIAPVQPRDRQAIRAACTTLVSQAFDIAAMAPDVAAGAWQQMSAEQRRAYTRGLTKHAVADCVAHGSEMAGNIVELVGVRTGDSGDRLVAVRQSKGSARTVVWRLRPGAGGALRAVDMTVDGRSLAAAAERDAKDVLARTDGNVIALIRSVGG
jgi:ABC-type transporter MlaC component